MGTSWADFERTEPDFAATVVARFEQYKHHVLATLRADGFPRATGIEVNIRFGELWLGMMPNSRKALDLRRDPRCALHANPGPDASMADGDVRVTGRAVEVTDPETIGRFTGEVETPPGPFHLFRLEPTEVVRTTVDDQDLVLQVWRPGAPLRTIRRGNDDGPPRED